MATRIPTRQEYEANERAIAHAHIRNQPQRDPEAEKAWAAMLVDWRTLQERAEWLLCGNYGYGAMLLAQEIAIRPRLNRAAALGQLVAAFECMLGHTGARAVWSKQEQCVKDTANAALLAAINAFLNERVLA